jgi:hypothetical protein
LIKEINENGFAKFHLAKPIFYDYAFEGNKFQLFSEFGTRLFWVKKKVANNSIELAQEFFFKLLSNQ